ncbi:MAG TPA: hypothetical protein VLV87_03385, partial [Gammaproteobacteria bacterium]|nr:hypothetical protein [Gammaproteobacteria bacterium]
PPKPGLSRKCISIYLYTKDRPAEEIAPLHGTFYVQRPLPEGIKAGHTLSADEVTDIKRLLTKRDGWIKFYQDQELKFSRESDVSADYIRELLASVRLPFTGYLLQKPGSAKGVFADGWASSHLQVTATPSKTIKSLRVRGWIPEDRASGMRLRATVDGKAAGEFEPKPGREFEWALDLPSKLSREFTLNIEAEGLVKKPGGDDRDLAFVLIEVQAQH